MPTDSLNDDLPERHGAHMQGSASWLLLLVGVFYAYFAILTGTNNRSSIKAIYTSSQIWTSLTERRVKRLMFVCSVLSVLLLLPNRAFAFNFGFVRAPDWMDPYIGWPVVLTCVFWLGLAATKPRGVPFKQVRFVKISPIANFFYLGMAFFFTIMMVMLFTGMGLRRYAEWTGAA